MNEYKSVAIISILLVVVMIVSIGGSFLFGERVEPLERVSERGALQVIGTQLCGEDGEPIVLRGMSTSGYMWHPLLFKPGAVEAFAENTGANLYRVAMYTSQSGYITNRWHADEMYETMDAALASDLYVIIDWHILYDNDPLMYLESAKEFFAATAERYKDEPGVIYEICNEPNGDITWADNVKPYAEEIIPIIREHDPDSVILVGSPSWSTDVRTVANDPLDFENVMYTYHFYAGTHDNSHRENIDYALEHGIGIFVSEWGTTDATGAGELYLESAQEWVDFMSERKLSWANWSMSASDGSGALTTVFGSGRWEMDDLSESGKFVFDQFHQ